MKPPAPVIQILSLVGQYVSKANLASPETSYKSCIRDSSLGFSAYAGLGSGHDFANHHLTRSFTMSPTPHVCGDSQHFGYKHHTPCNPRGRQPLCVLFVTAFGVVLTDQDLYGVPNLSVVSFTIHSVHC